MHRSLPALALCLAVTPALAQRHETDRFTPISGEPQYAGVYHVATGTWTHGAMGSSTSTGTVGGGVSGLAATSSQILYNCTSGATFSTSMTPGEIFTASGRVPSTSSPESCWNPFSIPVGSAMGSVQGCADSYAVEGFQLGYCSQVAGNATAIQVAFYQSWNPVCSSGPIAPPTGGPINLAAFPGVTAGNPSGCWIVDIDLTASSQAFTMLADGDGAYSANTDDAFAWSISFPSILGPSTTAGPLIAGCPVDGTGPSHPGHGWINDPPTVNVEHAGYDGTFFDRHGSPCAGNVEFPANGAIGLPLPGGEPGTDMVGDDGFRDEGGTPPPANGAGCYFFGGPLGSGGAFDGPYSNFYLELYGAVVCTLPPGDEFCAGDGLDPLVTTACPCANFGFPGNGCATSFNPGGAHLDATGTVFNDDVVLHGTEMNSTGISIYVKGDNVAPAGLLLGDGVTCVDGTLIRLRQKSLLGGESFFPDSTDTITLSVRGATPVGSGLTGYYHVYYRNAASSFCPPATFNGTSNYRITW